MMREVGAVAETAVAGCCDAGDMGDAGWWVWAARDVDVKRAVGRDSLSIATMVAVGQTEMHKVDDGKGIAGQVEGDAVMIVRLWTRNARAWAKIAWMTSCLEKKPKMTSKLRHSHLKRSRHWHQREPLRRPDSDSLRQRGCILYNEDVVRRTSSFWSGSSSILLWTA